ncbi:hypothetical protein PoB_006543300 [Plakobranchus ocellatus]|uniref:Uncharacterized protein n=1 Tax=Plakobranchus ocellatus TaxID=259542 RepID=A0AAV4D483_9GAST|nr:hypothetical protein PoB_006543300 [Plakobranchus ocellatus]
MRYRFKLLPHYQKQRSGSEDKLGLNLSAQWYDTPHAVSQTNSDHCNGNPRKYSPIHRYGEMQVDSSIRRDQGLSVGPHWRQQFTCPTLQVLKYSLSFVRAHTKSATCRSVGAILCVLKPGVTSVTLLDKGRGVPLREHA